jgi:NAD(P)-dependent dehydrogenase (short-subunit alcohol dehydrogenase family)
VDMTDMNDMNGKRVVLLGGTAGIGLATARRAAGAGAEVVVASRSRSRVDAALELLPSTAEGYAVDLSSEAATAELLAELGAFDHLVFTAGETLALHALDDTDLTEARRFFETRFWGALAAAKHGHTRIRPGGSITLMSGSAGARPQATWTVAATICSGVEAMVRALAMELAPIRVNCVAPGVLRTDLWAGMDDATRQQFFADVGSQLLTGRVGEAEEVADSIMYLMGNGYTTGITLPVDGGATLV